MKAFVISLFLCCSFLSIKAQMSCAELKEVVIDEGGEISSYCCFDSDFLTGVDFYELELDGEAYYFALVSFDYASPYIYCIPYDALSEFRMYAFTDQAGEAFHAYIKPYKCDCY